MVFDWAELIELAEVLYLGASSTTEPIPSGPDEARFRAAVSRAYYGVHMLSRAIVEENYTQVGQNSCHTDVLNYFRDLRGKTREQQLFYLTLQRLHSDRIQADYKIKVVHGSTAKAAVASARKAVDLLDQF